MLLTGEDQSTWRSASTLVTISTTNSTCNSILVNEQLCSVSYI